MKTLLFVAMTSFALATAFSASIRRGRMGRVSAALLPPDAFFARRRAFPIPEGTVSW